MIRNYFFVAIRNLLKNKFYSGLNILGLSIGIACFIVILSYVKYELSYDRFNSHVANIIRITEKIPDDAGKMIHSATTPSTIQKYLSGSVSSIDQMGRLFPIEVFVSFDNTVRYLEKNYVFADSSIIDIFSFDVVAGNFDGFNLPFNIIIAESTATKYFGDSDPIGRTLKYEDESSKHDFNVIAVIKDLPDNTHFEFDFLASFISLETIMPWYDNWHWPQMYTYALVSSDVPVEKLLFDVNQVMQLNLPVYINERAYDIQKLEDIHLRSNLESEWKANNRIEYVAIFSIIAIFILVIACINFINLATSKSIQRAKEVGVRKVMGASKSGLMIQYLGESILVTLMSFIIAFALTEWVLLVAFNKIVGVNLSLSYLFIWPNWAFLIVSVVIVAMLSGLYPAFVLTGFKPIWIFRGRGKYGRSNSKLRKGLVVFQFAISGFLIASTLVIYQQVNFIQHKNLGFEKDMIVALKLNNREDQRNVSTLKQQLLSQGSVDGVTVSSHLPGSGLPYDNPVMPENSAKEDGYNLFTLPVDHDFIDVYDLELLEGRKFSKENKADETSSIIINQSALNRFGWDIENALGKMVELTWYSDSAEIRETKVIGIVKDFNFNSLRSKVEPIIIYLNDHVYYTEYVSVRFKSGNISNAIEVLTREWSKYSERPADIYFLSNVLERLYTSETRASKVIVLFTILAIIISCLGLFGLSAYSTETRTKEIGIRKVMGADISTIVSMLVKDYLLLICLANVISLPLAWYFGYQWLEKFAYRTSLGAIIFISAFVISLGVAFATVSFQSIKAALTNPANILKDE